MDKRIAHAVALKIWCREASIPKAMHATKFTLAESSNPVKQMAIRRAYEKAINRNKTAPSHPKVIAALPAGTGSKTVSLLTSTIVVTDSSSTSPPLTPTIRANNTALPVLVGWSTEDEKELMRIKN